MRPGPVDGERVAAGFVVSIAELPRLLPHEHASRRIDRGVMPFASLAATFWILVTLLAIEWTIRKWLRLA